MNAMINDHIAIVEIELKNAVTVSTLTDQLGRTSGSIWLTPHFPNPHLLLTAGQACELIGALEQAIKSLASTAEKTIKLHVMKGAARE